MSPDPGRQPPPPLPAPAGRPGEAVVQSRSWPVGRQQFTALVSGEPLEFEVEFRADFPPPEAVGLQIDFLGAVRPRSERLAFEPAGGRGFRARAELRGNGAGRLRLRYRRGGEWFWDAAPPGWFVISPAHVRGLRAYTFLPTVSGHLGQWRRDLDRIAGLGFNTVYLLPVTAMDGSESPYAAADLFELDRGCLDPDDPRPGPEQFTAFVDDLRARRLRLCVDVVLNHVGVTSRVARSRPDWLTEDPEEADGIRRAGWSDGRNWHKWRDAALLNYEPTNSQAQHELWDYMTAYARFWAGFAAATGGLVRLDNLHSSHTLFMRHVLAELRTAYPELMFLGELFTHGQHLENLALDYGLNLLLATPWEHKFGPQLREYLRWLHHQGGKLAYFFPVTSQDSGSPAQEFGSVASTVPRLAVSALLGPGPWGIVQGVEYGLEKRLDFIGRHPRLELAQEPPRFGDLITWLTAFTAREPVFHRPGNLRFVDDNHEAVLAAVRLAPGTMTPRYLVATNLDIFHEQRVRLNLPAYGFAGPATWRDAQSGQVLPAPDGQVALALPPCSFRVFELVAGTV